MIIDVHTHYLPEGCIVPTGDETTEGAPYTVQYVAADTGNVRWTGQGKAAGFDLEQLHDLTRRRADMERQGVDVQVLSVPPPFGFTYTLEPTTSHTICQFLNDALGTAAARDPAHFLALATLPLQSPERSVAELDRAVTDLGMDGVAIGTHVGEWNLDHPALLPFFERLEQLDVPLFIHSTVAMGGERVGRYHLKNLIGNPTEDAVAVASLIFGGVLDNFPALKVFMAHGGGSSPFLLGRWDRGWQVRPEARGVSKPPSQYFSQLWFDSLTHSPAALEYLVQVAGPQRVVLGTDYPYDMCQPDPTGSLIAAPGLSDSTRQMVGGANAASLFSLGGRTEAAG